MMINHCREAPRCACLREAASAKAGAGNFQFFLFLASIIIFAGKGCQMEPHGQARGSIQAPVWGDIPVKRWRIPPPISIGGFPTAGMKWID